MKRKSYGLYVAFAFENLYYTCIHVCIEYDDKSEKNERKDINGNSEKGKFHTFSSHLQFYFGCS